MEAKKREHPVYTEQYKSQAVELMIHSGKSVVQIARELGCSEASLHGWKKAYLKRQSRGKLMGGSRVRNKWLRRSGNCTRRWSISNASVGFFSVPTAVSLPACFSTS